MVACGRHGRWQAVKDCFVIMRDGAGFAVHQVRSADYMTAKGCANCLMSQEHAKNGDLPCEVADQIDADAGILRSAGARRKYDTLRLQGLDIGDRELVVTANLNLGAEFPEILNQVIGKGIVVVENKDHGNLCPACSLHVVAGPVVIKKRPGV